MNTFGITSSFSDWITPYTSQNPQLNIAYMLIQTGISVYS